MLTGAIVSDSAAQEFHPQILALPNGTVGCAFYEFGYRLSDVLTPGGGNHLRYVIDVVLVASLDRGVTFTLRDSVCDKPWNPRTGAPWAHGDPNVTFIGEYFGFDADSEGFRIVWTDTRTGMQELFSAKAYVQTSVTDWDDRLDTDMVFIPMHGSSGGVLVNRKTGKVVPVPYPDFTGGSEMRTRVNPIRDVHILKIDRLLEAFAIIEGVSDMTAQAVKGSIMAAIGSIAAEPGVFDTQDIAEQPLALDIQTVGKRDIL